MEREKIVMSVGGSLIFPNKDGYDVNFLKQFRSFILSKLFENPQRQFFMVIGGGYLARHSRDVAKKAKGHEVSSDDLDWLGIHATRMNAHEVRTVFREHAYPTIIEGRAYENPPITEKPIVVAAGWKPGWSTDFCAVRLCEYYGSKTMLNLSDIEQAYDKDPAQHADAKPLDKTSWNKFCAMVGSEWIPGMNVPFDPIAAQKASELNLTVIILKGSDFRNLENYFAQKEFVGTVISS